MISTVPLEMKTTYVAHLGARLLGFGFAVPGEIVGFPVSIDRRVRIRRFLAASEPIPGQFDWVFPFANNIATFRNDGIFFCDRVGFF